MPPKKQVKKTKILKIKPVASAKNEDTDVLAQKELKTLNKEVKESFVDAKISDVKDELTDKIIKVDDKVEYSQDKIDDIDKRIIEIQKSTKTLFQLFSGLHNLLRAKSKTYYNWSMNPNSSLTHWVILIICFIIVLFLTGYGFGFFGGAKPGTHAAAGIAKMINYQGKLTDLNNVPVDDGTYNLVVKIYDAETGGNCLWAWKGACGSPTAVPVVVTNGNFSVMLGDTAFQSTNAMTLDFNSDSYFLGIKVGADPEMTPRKRIGAVGYAYNADRLDGWDPATGISGGVTLTGGTDADDMLTLQGNSASSGNTGTNAAFQLKVGDSGGTTALTVLNNGNIGIGTVSPSTLLQLGTPGTTAGIISLAGSTAGLLTLQSAANFTPYTFTLPASGGTSGYVMQTDGTGITSWVDPLTFSGMYWTRNSGGSYLYNSNYLTDRVFIGLNGPTPDTGANSTLNVNNKIEIYRPDSSSYSELIFTNTAGTGDFRIYGDGNDIYWQGGGGRSLQMGSYWTTILMGDTQTSTPPAFQAGLTNLSVLVASSRTASVTLAARSVASQTADLQQWQNSASTVLAKVDASGNFGIGNGTNANKGKMDIMSAGNGTTPLVIENTSGTNILEAKDMSTNFGLSVDAGAFMDRNSAIQEEFNKSRNTLTADTTGNQGSGMGDGGGWGVYENTNCTFSTVSDTINGIMRITSALANNGCLSMMDEALRNIRGIVNANNLPIIMMKVRPSNVGANNNVFVGVSDTTDGQTTDPTNFIGFTNNGGTTWTGRTTDVGTSTNVTCTGQTISTAQFALLKVEVRANNNVRFFVDSNVSDGVNFSECGTGSSTNIPVINLAPELIYQSRTGGISGTYLDTDFFRVWQDDSIQVVSAPTNIDNPLEIADNPITEEDQSLYQISSQENSSESDIEFLTGAASIEELQKQYDINNLKTNSNLKKINENFQNQIDELKKQINVLQTNVDAVIIGNEKNIQGEILGNVSTDTLIIKNKIEFSQSIKFQDKINLNKDQAGVAKIIAGANKVSILYDKEYEEIPIAVATLKLKEPTETQLNYYVSEETLKGFSIYVNPIQNKDIEFNWHAFGVIDGVETSSDNTKVKINVEDYRDQDKPTSENIETNINVVY